MTRTYPVIGGGFEDPDPWTPADRIRFRVIELLADPKTKNLSDDEIARQADCDEKTVARVRNEIRNNEAYRLLSNPDTRYLGDDEIARRADCDKETVVRVRQEIQKMERLDRMFNVGPLIIASVVVVILIWFGFIIPAILLVICLLFFINRK